MKRRLIAAGFLAAALSALGAAKPDKNPLMSSDSVVWAGLDYSMVRMVGPGDFRNPEAIFPAMPQNWNDLFLRERIRKVEGALKKSVVTDVGGVNERNKTATPKQIVPTAGPDDGIEKSHLTDKDIAAAVRAYKLESKSGLGLVFIVNRLVKPAKKGAVYIVFFDAARLMGSARCVPPNQTVSPAKAGQSRPSIAPRTKPATLGSCARGVVLFRDFCGGVGRLKARRPVGRTLALTPTLSPGEREDGIQHSNRSGGFELSDGGGGISLSRGRGLG